MTKSQNIIGLAVISINDGRELGTVRDLIINPDKGAVEYLMVESDIWYLGAQVIPFNLLQGVGEYAVTVESPESISRLSEMEEVLLLIDRKVHVKGTKVLTKRGRLIGNVTEYFVDVSSGQITGCLLQPAKAQTGDRIIPSDVVVTYGRDVLIVQEDLNESELESYAEGVSVVNPNPAPARPVPAPVQIEKPETPSPKAYAATAEKLTVLEDVSIEASMDASMNASVIEEAPSLTTVPIIEDLNAETVELAVVEDDAIDISPEELESPAPLTEDLVEDEPPAIAAPVGEVPEVTENILEMEATEPEAESQGLSEQSSALTENPSPESGSLFGELQHRYYVGKTIGKTIESLTGEVIAQEGMLITEEVIEKVRQAGKYLELIMNAKD